MKTPRDIIQALGAADIAACIGVSPATVRNKQWQDTFPSAWWRGLDALCKERGLSCPRDAFAWADGAKAKP